MADTSTPTDRARFVSAVEDGGSNPNFLTLAAAVANCPLPMPSTTALLLTLRDGATFAQGVVQVNLNMSNGRAPY